jgi:ParB family chromosome partitioning protein|eukprot:COSAG06_NODE_2490_length_6769_cov_91.398501_2_plen_763_part_00
MDFDDPEMAEALLEEMEEKEEQLRLAAEFGQTLLERTEELQEENEAMEREKEAAVAEAEEHEYRARELQDNLDRLAEEAASKDAALDEARAEVERKEAEMEEKLKAMEGNDEELAAAQEQAKAEVAKAKADAAAEVKKLEEQSAAIKAQEEEMARARKEEEAKRIEAQEHRKEAEAKLKKKEEEMAKAEESRKEMEQKMEVERLKAEQQAADMQRKMQEMQEMERQMQEMQQQLAVANEMAAQKAAAGAPNSIDLEGVGESLGGSLFDDLGLSEGVPPEAKSPTSVTPRSLDAIKEQAEIEARTQANAHAKEQMQKEQEKLRAEYEAKLAAAQAESASSGAEVDEAAIKAEMEAKFKAEQEKTLQEAREEFARTNQAEMQQQMEQMRANQMKEMERQMAAAQRQKEYEMHLKQVSKAMKVDGQTSKEALTMLKQVNVEMLEASTALKAKAEELVSEEALAEAKAKIAASGKAGEQLDAAELAKTMSGLGASAFDNFAKLSEEEKAEMLANLTTVKSGAVKAGNSSERVRRGSQMVQDALKKQMTDDSELSALMEQGSEMAETSKSPAEIIAALKDNDAFVADVKKLVCEYIKEAVTTASVPTIDGTKKWGSYQISDLSIATVEIDPSNLDLAVEKSVTIEVANLSAEFDQFNWTLDKTSGIPKVNDKGTGQATMVNFSVKVLFDIVSDPDTGVGVKFSPPVLELEALDVRVNDCKHEWIFNKMLKWFQDAVKDAVLLEVRSQATEKVDALADKVSTLVNTLF